MLFNSWAYMIFLPCVFVIYWVLPQRVRYLWLLGVSYYFYMSWNVRYALLILLTTVVTFLCAIRIEFAKQLFWRRFFLILPVGITFGILFVFKYFNFTMEMLSQLAPISFPRLEVLLPVGISFYTFQSVSYVVDIYRGKIRAERNFGVYAAFVAFFPQLVAGPIERSSHLLPQINHRKGFDYNEAAYGVRLILWGLYKKMVIADNLSVWVDRVYADVYAYQGGSLLAAMFFFSIQIYCDFSGYSDIARGSAKLFHIDLMENFKSPYFSASIREFWSRWHISLSTWFRDYVYIPLGGNRVSKGRGIFNTLVTFLVSGLWHGAGTHFITWGGIHGVGQVCENVFAIQKKKERDLYWGIRVVCIFAFVTIGWVFFRAEHFQDAVYMLTRMFSGIGNLKGYLLDGAHALGIGKRAMLKMLLVYVLPLVVYDWISLKRDVCVWIGEKRRFFRYLYMLCMIGMLLLFGYAGTSSFVYFQF